MDGNYSLADIASVTGNEGFGGNAWILIILFAMIFGNGGFGFNRQNDLGQYATSASQQDILFSSKFSDLDNKLDRGFTSLGNGISDATFALNNSIKDGNSAIAGTVVAEGRAIGDKLCDLKTAVHAEGEATRALIQQNKIETLQAEINELKTQNMFCGIPRINPYGYTAVPNCGCGNVQ